jgi:hypothetical protein
MPFTDPPDDTSAWAPDSARALTRVILAGLVLLGVVVLGTQLQARPPWTWLFAATLFVSSAYGLAGGVEGLLALFWRTSTIPGRLSGLFSAVASVGAALFGFIFAMFGLLGFSRGRQVRRFGRPMFAPLGAGSAWTPPPASAREVPPAIADGVAATWRQNGRTEHASVAAFAALSQQLMAVGAPPELVEAAHRDALDEMRHSDLCFALARGIDGQDDGPGALDAQPWLRLPAPRAWRLTRLAVDALIDGALLEGVSARIVAALIPRAESDAVRELLQIIARDEARHAAHGWELLAWCLQEGGQTARSAVLGAVAALPESMPASLPPAAADGAWEAWGVPGRELEQEAWTQVRERLRARVEKLAA